jgi:four helix bundle protein
MGKLPKGRAESNQVRKGRLQIDFVERVEVFSDRCLGVAEYLQECNRFPRVVDQLAGSGSSVGANIAEADCAMSVKDFRKSLAIALKELAETRYWLRLCVRRNWVAPERVEALLNELFEIRSILGTILARTRSS